MSTIAIFSDVHGNLPALQAVLKDIHDKNADQVYCLGDLVDFAPWPNEVIDLIRAERIPCLMGNHDERIAFNHPVVPLKKHNAEETVARIAAIAYTRQIIDPVCQKYLSGLPGQIRLTFNVTGRTTHILLVHASTRSNDEYIYEDHDMNDLQEMFAQENADILIMGHTHESYIRIVPASPEQPERLAINCGSVGRSREVNPLATYLLLTVDEHHISAEIIKLAYPVHETAEAIRQSDIPDFYADFLLR
jgi:putative phosphoesterase